MQKRRKTNTQNLEVAIGKLQTEMDLYGAGSKEYAVRLKHLEAFYRIQAGEPANVISADMMASIAGHLLGIVIITNHEQLHVLSTKALGMLVRIR